MGNLGLTGAYMADEMGVGESVSPGAQPRAPFWSSAIRAIAKGAARPDETDLDLLRASEGICRRVAEMEGVGEAAAGLTIRVNPASSLTATLRAQGLSIGAWAMGIGAAASSPARAWLGGFAEELEKKAQGLASRALSASPTVAFADMRPKVRRWMANGEDRFEAYLESEESVVIGTGVARALWEEGQEEGQISLSRILGEKKAFGLILLHEIGHYLSKRAGEEMPGSERAAAPGAAAREGGRRVWEGIATSLSVDAKAKSELKALGESEGFRMGEDEWEPIARLRHVRSEIIADAMACMLSRNLSLSDPQAYPGLEAAAAAIRETRDPLGKAAAERGEIAPHGTTAGLSALPGVCEKMPRERAWSLKEMLQAADEAAAIGVARALWGQRELGGEKGAQLESALRGLSGFRIREDSGLPEALPRETRAAREREAWEDFASLAGADWMKKLEAAAPGSRGTEPAGLALWRSQSDPEGDGWGSEEGRSLADRLRGRRAAAESPSAQRKKGMSA